MGDTAETMSAENLEAARAIFESWASGDSSRADELIAPGIEPYPDPRSAWPGIESSCRGLDCNWDRDHARASSGLARA
jgi:hypothetical protein